MSRTLDASRSLLLLVGVCAAISLRVGLGGPEVAQSQPAALAFAVAMALLAVGSGWRPQKVRVSHVAIGALGATVLLVGPVVIRAGTLSPGSSLPMSSFPPWALLIVLVASTEEVVLRGALFDACTTIAGRVGAVVVTSLLFAIMHVPLYGAAALPLDLGVGLWLGGLRLVTGSVTAPLTAHVLADLAAWWVV
jgi:membrane protease YdiL (CAAX protease family)